MARLWDPLFEPKIPPEKGLCWFLPQEMRHVNFFLGAQDRVFWVGAKTFMVKNFMCFSVPYTLPLLNCVEFN